MQDSTAFGGVQIPKKMIAVFAALLLMAFLLGGASGYLVKGISRPIASQAQVSDKSDSGGLQTVETQTTNGTAVTDRRHTKLHLP